MQPQRCCRNTTKRHNDRNVKIMKKAMQPQNLSLAKVRAQYSTLVEDLETRIYFIVLRDMSVNPRKVQ